MLKNIEVGDYYRASLQTTRNFLLENKTTAGVSKRSSSYAKVCTDKYFACCLVEITKTTVTVDFFIISARLRSNAETP